MKKILWIILLLVFCVTFTSLAFAKNAKGKGASGKADIKIELRSDGQDFYVLAGTGMSSNGSYLAKLVISSVKKDRFLSIVLSQVGDANIEDIAEIQLCDENGDMVYRQGVDYLGTVIFFDIFVPGGKTISYYIKPLAKPISGFDPEGTANYARDIQYAIATPKEAAYYGLLPVKVHDAKSGSEIPMAEDLDGVVEMGEYSSSKVTTNIATVTGAMLTGIYNTMDTGYLMSGADIKIASYGAVFENSNNFDRNYEPMEALMTRASILIDNTPGVVVDNVRAHIEGHPSLRTVPVTPVDGLATIDLTTLGDFAYANGQINLVITADIYLSSYDGALVTVLKNLSYNGNSGDGVVFTESRLSYDEVAGVILIQ